MSWAIQTDHGEVDIEDSEIDCVERDDESLKIYLNQSVIAGEVCGHPRLTFLAPYTEKYGDGLEDLPLDFVQVVEYTGNKLVLSGMLNSRPWFVWEIGFSKLHITWGTASAVAT